MFKYDVPKKLYFLFIGKIIMELGAYIWPLFTLMAVDYFGFSEIITANFLILFSALAMIGTLIGGKLTDTIGRKFTFTLFMFLSSFCYLTAAFNEGYVLIALLACGTFLASCGAAATTAIIIDMCKTEKEKNDAFTLYYISMNFGFALGPLIAGFLYDAGFVKLLFFIDGFTTLLFALVIFAFIPETLPDKKDYQEVKGTKEEARQESIISIIFKDKILLYFLVSITLLFLVFRQFTFGVQLHADAYFENSGSIFGIIMSINAIVVVVLTTPIIKLVEKYHVTTRIILGGLFYCVGFGMLAFTSNLILFYISAIIWTIGETLISPSTNVFIASHTPINLRGRFGSVFTLVRKIGGMIGFIVAGSIIQYVGLNEMWIVIGVIALIGSFVAFKIRLMEVGKNKC